MKTRRPYTMSRRATAVEQTRRDILDAAVALHLERLGSEISLEDIAARAGTTVQTLLRHFGSRAGLVEAAFAHGEQAIREERRAPAGDVEAAIEAIEAHYELRGDGVLVLLAQEKTSDFARRFVESGRRTHRAWVEETFASITGGPTGGSEAEQTLDLLVVATDVYTWKLLRRDRGLSRPETRARLSHLVRALLRGHGREPT